MEETETRARGATLAAAPARAFACRDGKEAITIALAPIRYGEGPQIGVLGDTGVGKTTLMREIVVEYTRQSTGIALVVDDKERLPRYPGACRKSVDDLREHGITPEEAASPHRRIIVFRGDMLAGTDADPEQVAAYAWDLARLSPPRPTLVVHDELNRPEIAKNMQFRSGIKWVPASFAKGRAVGVGDLWGSQSPQDAPIAVFEQTLVICCFKLGGLGLRKLRERGYTDPGLEEIITGLHGMESPPSQRGDFVILQRGAPWNQQVYRCRPTT